MSLLACCPVDAFAQQVGVSQVPGVLTVRAKYLQVVRGPGGGDGLEVGILVLSGAVIRASSR